MKGKLTVKKLLAVAEKTTRVAGGLIEIDPPVPVLTPNGRILMIRSVGVRGSLKNCVNTTRFPTWFEISNFRFPEKSSLKKV